jgi:Cys-tRNA(Pro)/Cys-tRNA(Cys) deacylase
MSTRAIIFLKQRRIPFEVVHYDHFEKGAEFAARATGFPLERTVKTLVVGIGAHRHALVLLSGERQLDMRRLAMALAVKRAEMADAATAERLTGYHVGGISPFGTRQPLPVVMDAPLMRTDEVLINAGQRGVMLKMRPMDIQAALDCIAADVSHRFGGSAPPG